MAKLRLQPPEILESEASVVVYIKHEPLASVEASIMSYLSYNTEITNRVARQESGVSSEETVKSTFRKLRTRGLIESIPGRAKVNAAWRKAGAIQINDEHTLVSDYHKYPEYEKLIIDYLDCHDEITNTIGRVIIGVKSAATVKNIFYRLRDKGLREIIPNRSRLQAGWRKAIEKNDL